MSANISNKAPVTEDELRDLISHLLAAEGHHDDAYRFRDVTDGDHLDPDWYHADDYGKDEDDIDDDEGKKDFEDSLHSFTPIDENLWISNFFFEVLSVTSLHGVNRFEFGRWQTRLAYFVWLSLMLVLFYFMASGLYDAFNSAITSDHSVREGASFIFPDVSICGSLSEDDYGKIGREASSDGLPPSANTSFNKLSSMLLSCQYGRDYSCLASEFKKSAHPKHGICHTLHVTHRTVSTSGPSTGLRLLLHRPARTRVSVRQGSFPDLGPTFAVPLLTVYVHEPYSLVSEGGPAARFDVNFGGTRNLRYSATIAAEAYSTLRDCCLDDVPHAQFQSRDIVMSHEEFLKNLKEAEKAHRIKWNSGKRGEGSLSLKCPTGQRKFRSFFGKKYPFIAVVTEEARIQMAFEEEEIKQCGCSSPYDYSISGKFCDVSKLTCLRKIRGKGLPSVCKNGINCFRSCAKTLYHFSHLTQHQYSSDVTTAHSDALNDAYSAELNLIGIRSAQAGGLVVIDLHAASSTIEVLDSKLAFNWLSFFALLGGAAGAICGASFVTVLEWVYLILSVIYRCWKLGRIGIHRSWRTYRFSLWKWYLARGREFKRAQRIIFYPVVLLYKLLKLIAKVTWRIMRRVHKSAYRTFRRCMIHCGYYENWMPPPTQARNLDEEQMKMEFERLLQDKLIYYLQMVRIEHQRRLELKASREAEGISGLRPEDAEMNEMYPTSKI